MKVKANVYVIKDGYPVLLTPGDTVPEGVEVTNPDVIDTAEDDTADADAPAPRKSTSRKTAPASE